MVKRDYCSYREWGFGSQHPKADHSSRGSLEMPSSILLKLLHIHGAHKLMQAHIYTYTLNIGLFKKSIRRFLVEFRQVPRVKSPYLPFHDLESFRSTDDLPGSTHH